MKLYNIQDHLTKEEREKLGLTDDLVSHRTVKARQTNEYRAPKEGEWYLSGAIKGAYRARHDMLRKFRIAELYKIER